MAAIHFVKDGKRPNGERITRSIQVCLNVVTDHLNGFEFQYTTTPPTFKPMVNASNFAPYKYVVLEVGEGESNPSFPDQGYYYLVGVNPEECQDLVGIAGPLL